MVRGRHLRTRVMQGAGEQGPERQGQRG
jgi:hypothetical protein